MNSFTWKGDRGLVAARGRAGSRQAGPGWGAGSVGRIGLGGEVGAHVDDHEMHDGLGHEVSDALVDDGHIRVHQIPDGLHLPFQLWVHGEGV